MARTSGSTDDNELVSELVASSERRAVIKWLAEHGPSADFDTLVDVVDESPDRTMTAIRLHHVHLPKLASKGAIEWEQETHTIRLTAESYGALAEAETVTEVGQVADD